MYQKYFDFKTLPFENTPNPAFFFMGAQYRETLALMIHRVTSRKGLLCIVGPVGCGKTTLATTLTSRLPKGSVIIPVVHPKTTPEELSIHIAESIGLAEPPDSHLQRSKRIREKLIDMDSADRLCLLIIDEAQFMSKDLLQEILMLSNFETRHHKLIQILLLGQLELLDNLNRSEMRQLMQRISVTRVLRPMDKTQSIQYIKHRMKIAGGFVEIFSNDALDLIAAYSGGIPRVINNLCDAALLKIFVAQKDTVDAADIRASVSELGMDVTFETRQTSNTESELFMPSFSEEVPYRLATSASDHADTPSRVDADDVERMVEKKTDPTGSPAVAAYQKPVSKALSVKNGWNTFIPKSIASWSILVISLIVLCTLLLILFQQHRKTTLFSQPPGAAPFKPTEKISPETTGNHKTTRPPAVSENALPEHLVPSMPSATQSPSSATDQPPESLVSMGPKETEKHVVRPGEDSSDKDDLPASDALDPISISSLGTYRLDLQTKTYAYPYSVYTGAYSTAEGADKALATYREMDLDPYWVKVSLKSGEWYRVFLGHFRDSATAEHMITAYHLTGAEVRQTRFSVFIGTFSSQMETTAAIRSLSEIGYRPYAIVENGFFHVFIGAFYTRPGAETLYRELIHRNIQGEVVER